MDNNDFDNLFSDQLNQEQDFNFQESDWEDLNERMAGQKGRRRFILPFWLSLAGSVLLGSLFYLWYANRQTNNELEALRMEITKMNEEKTIDTVYQEVIVYQTDTVYQNINNQIQNPKSRKNHFKLPQTSTTEEQRITSEEEEQSAPKGGQALNRKLYPTDRLSGRAITSSEELQTINQELITSTSEEQPQTPNRKPITSTFEEQPQTSNPKTSTFEEQPQTSNHKLIAASDLHKVSLFAEKETTFPILDYVTVAQNKKPAKKRNKVDFGAQFGATAGWGYADIEKSSEYYNSSATNWIGNPDVINRNSYTAGMQGELHIDDKIRLTSGVFYERLKVEVDNYLAVDNIPNAETLEDLQVAGADLQEYNNAGILQQTLNYEFGLKYAFESENKWRPYLGAGILGQSSLKRNIKYSSNNSDDNAYSVRLDSRSAEVSATPVFFYGLRATAGTEFSISDHFGLQLEGYYNYNYKTFNDRHLNLFGARAGVYFKF